MKNVTLIIICLISINGYSQKIKGKVFDLETKKPIEKAHIQIGKTLIITDKKGYFSFKQNNKSDHKITISHIAYLTKEIAYGNKKSITIYLKPKAEFLEEVVVKGNKGKNKLVYEVLPQIPNKTYSFASVLYDDKILVFGGDKSYLVEGFKKVIQDRPGISILGAIDLARSYVSSYLYSNQLCVFNLKTSKWIIEDITLRKRANHSAALVGNKIYLLGGKRLTKSKKREYLDEKIEVYDPINKTIEIDNTNPHRAADLQTLVYKDKIYVLGGSVKKKDNGKKYYSNKFHSYNPKTGMWYLLAELPFSEETSSCIIEDVLYFFDGFDNNNNINTIMSLNLASGKLKAQGRLFYDFKQPAITKKEKTIFLFENGKLLTFDTEDKEIKEYRIDLFLFASKIYVQDNFLYILGGYLKTESEVFPQNKFFKVDLRTLSKTKARKYIQL